MTESRGAATRNYGERNDPGPDKRSRRFRTECGEIHRVIIGLLLDNPGGITKTEIRELMRAHEYDGFYQVESIMTGLPDDFPVWEETDEEGEIWYHAMKTDSKWRGTMETRMPENKPGLSVLTPNAPLRTTIKVDTFVHRQAKRLQLDMQESTGASKTLGEMYDDAMALYIAEKRGGLAG